mmetsp:Transcript_17776/g.49253  ORF Transcript_17776/g.49253 Transcript_17776/m.49253 type:complete len:170 (+) Transcript_17776:208-717(+)
MSVRNRPTRSRRRKNSGKKKKNTPTMMDHGRMVAMASVVSVASIGAVFGFAIVPPNNRALERRGPLSISVPLRKRNRSASASSSSSITVAPWSSFPSALMYADSGSSNDDARDWTVDEATLSPPTTTKKQENEEEFPSHCRQAGRRHSISQRTKGRGTRTETGRSRSRS